MSSVEDVGVERTAEGKGSERLSLRLLIGEKFNSCF